jgi:GNAT superfamily N-acetyltransferase
MDLPDGYTDVPRGKIAAIQTFLEMRSKPELRADPPGVVAKLRHVSNFASEWYLRLYHRIGDPYLWFARLTMSREQLESVITDPRNQVYALECGGSDEGLLELDFRLSGECEIGYFGVSQRLVGTGAGRWLMNRALELAWSQPIARLWVHTCTLDHPAALGFYLRSGFTAYARKVEIGDDPRLRGLIARGAAPHVPIIE